MNLPSPHLHIQWHEGMLLSPQHFQQESARVDALLAWQMLSTNSLAWGVKSFDIDANLLANGVLRVTRLEAIFPDGTAVVHRPDTPEQVGLELDLSEFDEYLSDGELDVFVALAVNRALNTPGQASRFRGVEGVPVSDEVSEALPVDLPRMDHHVVLLAGPTPAPLYLSMRLLSVRKENEVFKTGDVLPPLLSISSGHPVWGRTLAAVTQLRTKAVFLAKLTSSPSSRLEDRLEALEQRNRLASLVQPLAKLQGVLAAPDVSAFALYMVLCEQLGPLAMLKPGAVPIQPPKWQHGDPAYCFEVVLNEIEDLLGEVSQEWRSLIFGFDGRVFSLPGESLTKAAYFYIGLRGQTDAELTQWMNGAVIGSETIWTSLSDRRVLGAARKKVEQVEELGLRASSGYTIYAIEMSENFIVADQPLLISNANESKLAPRPREIVLFEKANKA
jgi:type VI secretion system protein ImpJ